MFEWSEEHKQIRNVLRQFLKAEIEPLNDAMEANTMTPYEPMRKLASLIGLAELSRQAVEHACKRASGGTTEHDAKASVGFTGGSDPHLAALLTVELSRINPGFTLAFGATVGLCGQTILRRGTARQIERWARPVLSLEKIGAWAITEPGSGSDAFGMRTTAKRIEGDRYLLNGSKTFITNAPYADVMIVYAKLVTPDEPADRRPPQGFVLERGMKGLSTGPCMQKMGMHSSPTGEIFLDDVEVGREHLLGEMETEPAHGQVVDVFKGERTGVVPMCLGIIERVLEDSLSYSNQRTTWGHPISSYQLIQEKLANMMVAYVNVKNILMKQLWSDKNVARVSLAEASAQKLYATRVTTDVCLDAIQIMGGNGYMKEYQVERFMRDAKLLQIGGGTDEIQILHVARDLIEKGLPS